MRYLLVVLICLCLATAVLGVNLAPRVTYPQAIASAVESIHASPAETTKTVLDECDYGYLLDTKNLSLVAWWCEDGWKIGARRPAPTGTVSSAIHIEAAGNEYQSAQIVLNPKQPGTILQAASVTDLIGTSARVPSSQVKLYEVATVPVTHPTDYLGQPGDYPDPLPPLNLPMTLSQGVNRAIWVSTYVPANTPAGDYYGTVSLKTNRGEVKAKLRVSVFGFTLPSDTHLRSRFGISEPQMRRYHHLQTRKQEEDEWQLYMRSFSEHRISPDTFSAFDPLEIKFVGEGSQKQVVIDWSAFDKEAKHAFDDLHFNSFCFPIEGMGGGTFYSRVEPEFGGYKADSPQYIRLWSDYVHQIETHLTQKGWLDKVVVYWFDEPSPKDFQFCIDGMDRLKKYAPGLRRLLTVTPEPSLYGHVDVWTAKTPKWTPELSAERKRAGDEVWSYICCDPVAPYVGEFIEHPGVELRLWPWQSWQYGVQGILVWESLYWTSRDSFPGSLQDPWKDAASYMSGYGTASGSRESWGNGDGRFFYPPRVDPNKQTETIIAEPISSIRLENLRDGMQDYEYFYMLQRNVDRLRGTLPAGLIGRAEELLKVPESVSTDLTHFTCDPRPLLAHRRKLGEMIALLQKVK